MPYCPNCQAEYIEGILECPDCRVALVEQLPVAQHKEVDLVGLHPLPGIVYADMVKEALENAGIACVVKSDTMTAAGFVRGANSAGEECQIYVDKKDKRRAESILHAMLDHI